MPASAAVPLRVGHVAHALFFFVRVEYLIDNTEDGLFDVRIVGYSFRILEPENREIAVFQWHPFGASPVHFPHLHLSTRLPAIEVGSGLNFTLAQMHIPTGFVTLADVVRLLTTEFGVEPRRADWESILNEEMPTASAS